MMHHHRDFFFFYKEVICPFMFKKLGSRVAGVGGAGEEGTLAQPGTDLDLPSMVEDNQAQQDDRGEADEAFECK